MVLRFYYDLVSQPCRSIYIFLELTKIPFESRPIALRKGEHRGAEFSKINPIHTVPAIDDDGFYLAESIAILQYLAHKYKVANHWYPVSDIKLRARVDEYTQWHHINTRFQSAMLWLTLRNTSASKPADEQQVQKWEKNVGKVVSHLDNYFLKDRKFLCGDFISIADLLCICELTQLHAVNKEQIYLGNDKIRRWAERVQKMCGISFDDSHKIIHRARAAFMENNVAKL